MSLKKSWKFILKVCFWRTFKALLWSSKDSKSLMMFGWSIIFMMASAAKFQTHKIQLLESRFMPVQWTNKSMKSNDTRYISMLFWCSFFFNTPQKWLLQKPLISETPMGFFMKCSTFHPTPPRSRSEEGTISCLKRSKFFIWDFEMVFTARMAFHQSETIWNHGAPKQNHGETKKPPTPPHPKFQVKNNG